LTRNPLTTDIAIAVVAAIVLLIVAPGLAVAGLIALIILIFAAVSFVRQSRKRRGGPKRRTRPDRRAQPPSRPRRRPPRR
jgi:hypothetical protein